MSTDSPEPAEASYWYDDDAPVVPLLQALRRFRACDQRMRRQLGADMDLNVTDLQAVRHVIAAELGHQPATPGDVSAALGISTASTTKLVDRLTASGHLVRTAHPTDRRSVVLGATPHCHQEVREHLGPLHRRMAEIARSVPPGSRRAVVDFLLAMSQELDGRAEPRPPVGDGPIVGAMATADLTSELLALEHAGWQALTTTAGGAHYERVMTADALMLVPGAVLTRGQVRHSLEAVEPWDSFRIRDARVVPAGSGAAVLVYTAQAVRGDLRYEALMSTTYVRDGDRWLVACHQQTPAPAP